MQHTFVDFIDTFFLDYSTTHCGLREVCRDLDMQSPQVEYKLPLLVSGIVWTKALRLHYSCMGIDWISLCVCVENTDMLIGS